jgi:hypothetical protein
MVPNYHPTPLSGGDREVLNKDSARPPAMINILAAQSAEMRARMASPNESAMFAEAKNSGQPSHGPTLVYLVELDGDATEDESFDPGEFPPVGRDLLNFQPAISPQGESWCHAQRRRSAPRWLEMWAI